MRNIIDMIDDEFMVILDSVEKSLMCWNEDFAEVNRRMKEIIQDNTWIDEVFGTTQNHSIAAMDEKSAHALREYILLNMQKEMHLYQELYYRGYYDFGILMQRINCCRVTNH